MTKHVPNVESLRSTVDHVSHDVSVATTADIYNDGWNDCIDHLHKRGLIRGCEWRPLEDTKPEEGDIVAVLWPNGSWHQAKYISGDFWFQSVNSKHLCNKVGFTHWMPIPKGQNDE